jgi:hypothetical protein
VLEWYPTVVKEAKEERVWAESQLCLEEPHVSGFSGLWEWLVSGVLTEEAEENASQGGIKPMFVCKNLQVGLESQEMGGTGWTRATEKVMVCFIGTALRGTTACTRLVKSKLLNLKRKNFVDPFGESFLLCKGEGEEGQTEDVPVDGIEESRECPRVVLAEIDVLFLECI